MANKEENTPMTLAELKAPPIWVQLILTLGLTILSGFTIMVMWTWYVVPLGLPAINMIHAIGLDLLTTFIVTTKKSDSMPFWENWSWGTMFALLTFFFGWLLHFAM